MKAKKKYFTGGKLANRASDALSRRSVNQAKKAEKSKAKSAELLERSKTPASGKGAGLQNLKNAINKERSMKRAQVATAQEARSTRSAKAAKFASKRGEIAAANKKNRGVKASIRKSYK